MLYVSSATGSRDLVPYLQQQGAPVTCGRIDNGDVEFIGFAGCGPVPIGVEHKLCATSDIFTSMADGRLTGEQLPKMVRAYPWRRYLIIEGSLRRAKDGLLEMSRWSGGGWEPAYSRNGRGWTYDEFENRIDSIQEFFSYPHCAGVTVVKRTYDQHESAAYIVGRWRWWSKPYEEHSSWRQWNESRNGGGRLAPVNPMIPTSEVDLTQLWAADIDGIGPKKSAYVARHFKTPRQLANATEDEWREVVCLESRKGQHNLIEKRFSREMIRRFIKQIETGKTQRRNEERMADSQ